ncbi:hypothetical protein [Parvicella tangerina]|uniref:Uncharacterized protein n=1 Tax=Parvicella tangerina TaxID=2829795 RepID=A0A916JN08_9FLAO|nr:hypothetical protein [Parvicella tangerina]CAG5081841.1 hypothetical protein CRYO30217_01742 [Parvicella tangerina]
MRLKFILIIFTAIAFFRCTLPPKVIPDEMQLKLKIIENLTISFHPTDTIFMATDFARCGNTDQETIDRFLNFDFEDEPYITIIQSKLPNSKIIYGKEMHQLFLDNEIMSDSGVFNRLDQKVIFSVFGRFLEKEKVEVIESYALNGTVNYITQVYVYENKKWSIDSNKIIDN